MKLRGIILDENKNTLPGANIYVSDSQGNIKVPTKGVASDIEGKYLLDDLDKEDFITIKFIGYRPIIKRVGDLGSGLTVGYNFQMQPQAIEGEEFTIVEEKDNPPVYLPPNALRESKFKKPLILTGIGLTAIITGVIVYKSIKG